MLVVGDIAVLYLALWLTLLLRYGSTYSEQWAIHLGPFSLIFPLWLLIFYIANIYEPSSIKNNIVFFSTFLYTMLINSVLAIVFFYLAPFIQIAPRRNLLIFVLIATLLALGWRIIYNRFLVFRGYRNNTLIVGLSDQAQELYDFLLSNTQLGYNAVGIIDVQNTAAATILEKVIREKQIKTLIIAREVYAISDIVDVLYRLVPLRLRFYNLPNFAERITGKIPLAGIDQTWFLDNLSEGNKRGYELAKRAFDILGALVIGIITIPIFVLIIIAIKLYAPGPVFYSQQRMGRTRRPITIIKFRTMILQAEIQGAVWAKTDDPRVTRIGKFLRATRLDELPQLLNVLSGKLSLVGPRPERPEFHDQLNRAIPFYNERYLIKPGLMGWAQLKYRYGASVQDALEKLQYDLYYIKNRSLLLDASIIVRTLNIVIRQAGK